jgi:hypothetical protein
LAGCCECGDEPSGSSATELVELYLVESRIRPGIFLTGGMLWKMLLFRMLRSYCVTKLSVLLCSFLCINVAHAVRIVLS